jgi:type III secretion system YscQ/HrcQ family protein
MNVQTFAWLSLPKASTADNTHVRALRTYLDGDTLARIAQGAKEVLGYSVTVQVDGVAGAGLQREEPTRPTMPPSAHWVGVLFGGVYAAPQDRWLLVVEPTLTSVVVGHALKRPPRGVLDPLGPVSARLAGAFAACAQAVVRHARGDASATVVSVGPAPGLWSDLRRARTADIEAHGTCIIHSQTLRWSLYAPPDLAIPPRATSVAALGTLPLSLPIVLGHATLPQEVVTDLGEGDVVLMPTSLELGAELVGRAFVAAPRAESGLAWVFENGGNARYEGVTALPWSAAAEDDTNGSMSVSTEVEDALSQVPVVVRLELGSMEMSARAWSELQIGDVVSTGIPLGAKVTLRASGIELARGELVQIDGELGVRITERVATR